MSGYIGNIPVPSATQSFETFTATGGQTSFGTAGYTPGYLQVYLNGVLLDNGSDYTASNGSDVVLAVGAISGDILTVISFSTFEVSNQAFTGDFSVDSPTFVVDSTNNRVGIGTASPLRNLDVVSGGSSQAVIRSTGSSSTVLRLQSVDTGTNDTDGIYLGRTASAINYLWTYENEPWVFATNNTERLRIDSSGNVGIGTSSPVFKLVVSNGGANGYEIGPDNSSGTQTRINSYNRSSSAYTPIGTNASYHYWLVNSSEAMRIDSSGNVGIGNTIPSSFNSQARNLVVGDGVNRQGITIYSGATEQANIFFADGTTGSDPVRGGINYNHSNDSLSLRVNDVNRLTITSTGVGLFGMTAADGPTGATDINGTEIGRGYLNLNRDDTADIRFIGFNLNGSTVGSIKFESNNLTIDNIYSSTKSGLVFAGSNISPRQNAALADNAIDLGGSSSRFKNLYLSGGVYVGGTGSANYLEDYETGTFTPTISFGGASVGVTYNNQQGYYIKVGKLVYVTMYVQLTNKGSSTGDAYIGGLPFTVGDGLSLTAIEGGGVFTYFANLNLNVSGLTIAGQGGTTTAGVRYEPTSGTTVANINEGHINNTFNSRITMTYNTT